MDINWDIISHSLLISCEMGRGPFTEIVEI